MSYYLLLELGSLMIPLMFSFHPRIRFHLEWPRVLPAIVVSMLFFVIWDIWFTGQGVWGFNEQHLLGWQIFKLPIEEWLFFLCIPYACLFIYHCVKLFLDEKMRIRDVWLRFISVTLVTYWITVAVLYGDRMYTLSSSVLAAISLLLAYYNSKLLSDYLVTYLIVLLPFTLVNGALTGSFTAEPVVWYNDAENMGIRVLTIPLVDFSYNFAMLMIPILIAEHWNKRKSKQI